MQSRTEVLTSVLKTVQMGQVGIRAVMNYAIRPELKKSLESQLKEYDTFEQEAYSIASSRGWEIKELDSMAKTMAKAYAKTRLGFDYTDSKIAQMMILGNTNGMIKTLVSKHHCDTNDPKVKLLVQKLLDCENANIKQMQGYV